MRVWVLAQTTRMKRDAAHMPSRANMREDDVAAEITENEERNNFV